MNNRVYIAGKITGDPNYREKFNAAAYEVETATFSARITPLQWVMRQNKIIQFKIVNPTEFTLLRKPLTGYCWTVGMAVCLLKLLSCSFIYMLKDWPDSKGATIEHNTARFFGKRIVYQDPHGAPKPKTKKNLVSAREKAKVFLGTLSERKAVRGTQKVAREAFEALKSIPATLKAVKVHLCSVQYCLRVMDQKGNTVSTYSLDKRILRNQARNLSEPCWWTLYQIGPFNIPEQIIDSGEVKSVHQTPEKP